MINTKHITNLYWFCLSVECGGFSAASIKARISAPTVSRSVAHLETQLNEKLLHRDAKNFQLTNAGEEVYRKFAHVFAELDQQWTSLSNSQGELTGDIQISCPEPFADFFLQPLAIEFMNTHPKVNIHVQFALDTDEFINEKIDLAIATVPTRTAHLVQRRLFETELALAASPSYLARYGEPRNAKELINHHLLASNNLSYWSLKEAGELIKVPIKAKYTINSLRLNIRAAIADAGICVLPKVALEHLTQQAKILPVLPDLECQKGTAYLVWTDRKMISSRVVAFRDLIFARMNSDPEQLWANMFS